jgi:predicted Zn-dependent protease
MTRAALTPPPVHPPSGSARPSTVPDAQGPRPVRASAGRLLALVATVLWTLQAPGLALARADVGNGGPRDLRSQLPELGDSLSGVVSREDERRLGELFLRSVRAQLPLHDDPQMLEFTEHLSYELAVHSQLEDRRLHVNLIDSPSLNAFAAPGGVIGVNLGLFLYAESVHEFASVMTHELAHLSQRHYARGVEQQQRSTLPYVLAMLASAAILAAGSGDAGMAALTGTQALAAQNQLRHSRDQEREADRIGITNLAAAGLDPHAAARMFSRMQDAFRYSDTPPEFLLTHPVTRARIADARNQTSAYPSRAYGGRIEYQLMRVRARLHYARSPASAAETLRAELGRLDPQTEALERQALEYGIAVALGRARQTDAALAELGALEPEHGGRIWYRLAQAEILLDGERTQPALELLEAQLDINLDNLPLSRLYVRALNQQGRHAEAVAVLQEQVQKRPGNEALWFELAETAGLAGDIVTVHLARAEYFQLHGALSQAMEHYQRALGMATEDYTLRARLRQRMADLRELRMQAAG